MNATLRSFAVELRGHLRSANPERTIRGLTLRHPYASPTNALALGRPVSTPTLANLARRGVPFIASPRDVAHRLPRTADVIVVSDPKASYYRFAAAYRRRLEIPVVAITGTAGKTTTKDMLHAILSQNRRVVATPENYNANPVATLLMADATTEIVVLEMGMDRPGGLTVQCRTAAPNIGVITNIGRAHVERCGSFRGVVRAKNELVHALPASGVLILNADDAGTKLLELSRFRGQVIRFGRAPEADLRLLDISSRPRGCVFRLSVDRTTHELSIPVVGEHRVYDALAAIAAARVFGVSWEDIISGLAAYRPANGRLGLERGLHGSLIIDDSYNANPLSVKAGLQVLCELGQRRMKIVVLGNLEEQGAAWREVHRELGGLVADAGIDYLVTVGDKAKLIAVGARAGGMPGERIQAYHSAAAAIALLHERLTPDAVVLIKGSHVTGMGRVARALIDPAAASVRRRS